MIKQIKSLWIPLVILALITVGLTVWYFGSDNSEVKNFCLSLGTCFLSAIIVAVFFDIYISARTHSEKLETARACLRALKPALVRLTWVYFNLVKATSASGHDRTKISPMEIVDSLNIDHVSRVNGMAEAPVSPTRSWITYFADANIDFAGSLEGFIEKYAVHLDAPTIDLCEQLANHALVGICRNSRLDLSFMQIPGFQLPIFRLITTPFEDMSDKTQMNEFLTSFKQLSALVEKAGDTPFEVDANWSNNTAPAVGSLLQDANPVTSH